MKKIPKSTQNLTLKIQILTDKHINMLNDGDRSIVLTWCFQSLAVRIRLTLPTGTRMSLLCAALTAC